MPPQSVIVLLLFACLLAADGIVGPSLPRGGDLSAEAGGGGALIQVTADGRGTIVSVIYRLPRGQRMTVIQRIGPSGEAAGSVMTVLESQIAAGERRFVTVAIYDPHGQVVERRVVMLGDRVVSGQHRPERSGAPFSADELLALARSLNFESGD